MQQVESLSGLVAFVTAGGGQGIGSAVCRELSSRGAAVAVTDRNGDRAHSVAAGICAGGGIAKAWSLDVTSSADVTAVVSDVATTLGHVSIVVNNAGVSLPAAVAEMTEERFDQVIDVSLRGTFLCSRAALQQMISKGFGRIINVSSYVAFAGSPELAHYAAAKAGIVGFTRSLALEVGKYNITVNAVAPGIIFNDFLRSRPEQFSAEIRERLERGTPVGRHGEPTDIARAVAFLASPSASFITGATVPVTGGLFML